MSYDDHDETHPVRRRPPPPFSVIEGHLGDPDAVALAKEALALAQGAPEMIILAILVEKKVCAFEDYEAMLKRLAEKFVYTLAKLREVFPTDGPMPPEGAIENTVEADLHDFFKTLR